MKKISAILLALVMMLSMVAMAADATHTITVSGAANGETYTAYKIFDLIVDSTGKSYNYTVSKTVYDALNGKVDGLTFTATTDADVYNVNTFDQATAEKLTEYLNDTKIGTAVATAVAANNTAVLDVSESGAGYYFVDSSLGALCAIGTTTNTSATVYEKNSIPSIKKAVKDEDDTAYTATANIGYGETVNYQLTVNTSANEHYYTDDNTTGIVSDYTIVDTLPAGITSTDETLDLVVKVGETTWEKDTDYTVSVENNVITIVLKGTGKLAKLAQNTDIVLTYDAKVETTAAVETALTNKAVLTYEKQTDEATATVCTFEMGLQKVIKNSTTQLEGAEFTLKLGETTMYFTVANGVYTVVDAGTEGATSTITAGKIQIVGLDAGVYTLTETKAPEGYNMLTAPISVEIKEGANYDGDIHVDGAVAADTDDVVVIENSTGSELPSTGGMGTTMFYVVGGLMMAAAVVLLVSKKKVNA